MIAPDHNPVWRWICAERRRVYTPGRVLIGRPMERVEGHLYAADLDALESFGWIRDITAPGGPVRFELTDEGVAAARAVPQQRSWASGNTGWVV